LFDVKLACKFYFACTRRRIVGMIGGIKLFDLSFGIVFNSDFQRT